ncbi:MAG: AraC family transcriptional regulator [Lachnospiraceae bacterium]|jgi:AraC-like DNA-binding protein|nr:AraC family transcriptional regulator [Lachnospiraceae bacterium]
MQDYNFSNDFFRNIDAMIYTCGYENCEKGHSYGPILRNGYLIHYVLGGCGIYKARGKLFRLGEGDAFLICPGELIYYEADAHDPWSYTWIGMQGIKVKGYLERTSLPDRLTVHYGQDDQIRLCHEKMFEADKLPQNRDLIMNSIMYEYLFLLARKFPGSQASPDEKKSGYVEQALKYIEGYYCDPITIQDIADHLNINRSYLHRIFKSFTGFSVQGYLLDYRLRQACILLKDTDLSVRIIAHSTGYTDPLYFSRIFSRKMGISPSTYRKNKQVRS